MPKKTYVPSSPFGHVQQLEHYDPGHQPARDHIGQRIQLNPHLALYLQQSGGQSVEKIKQYSNEHKKCGQFQLVQYGKYNGHTSAKNVEEGQKIRNILFHSARFP